VFISGTAQTGTNFLDTPNGRPGWASFFIDRGYVVYLTDQASRGRSPWHPSTSSMSIINTSDIEQIFTATSEHNLWPQSKLHTQWPGTGKVGDPIFDAFYASQVQFQPDNSISEAQNTKAYTALLEKIGPAHVITYSQAGMYGWRIGDVRPNLVKSIVALEPAGPPFEGQYPFFKLDYENLPRSTKHYRINYKHTSPSMERSVVIHLHHTLCANGHPRNMSSGQQGGWPHCRAVAR
jgi:pimeloyl-ACP methyl ester carboxylesterase